MFIPRIAQTDPPPDFIDLGSGNPGLELMPLEKLQRSAKQYFSEADPRTLQYGAEQGNGNFLTALADFLSAESSFPVRPDSLFTTAGASSGLDLLCTLFTQPGDVVFVEEPTYFLALRIFRDHRLEVISLPMDDRGLDINRLKKALERQQPKLLYTVPTFHNPASLTLPRDRREELVRLAEKHHFLLIADEVYHFLGYQGEVPRPFSFYSEEVPQVISLNSFSKILAPGLRLGWIQAHEEVIQQLSGSGLLDSGGGMNPFTSALVSALIEAGDLRKNIQQLKAAYQRRLEAMAAALAEHLSWAEYRVPRGGFFFWVRLPGVKTAALREKARHRKVDFRPGTLFSSQQGLVEHIRLSFSYYDQKQLARGIERLGGCLEETRSEMG